MLYHMHPKGKIDPMRFHSHIIVSLYIGYLAYTYNVTQTCKHCMFNSEICTITSVRGSLKSKLEVEGRLHLIAFHV